MEIEMPDHLRVQLPREKTAIVNGYIGPIGELIMDKTRMELRLHDGVKKGGHRFLSSTALASIFLGIDSEAGKLKFSGGQFGFVTRISNNSYKIRALTSTDGITITNEKGIDGNPVIGLPDRLAETVGNYAAANEIADCDLITVTGFYGLKANAKNLPADLLEQAGATLIVLQTSAVECTQLLTSIIQATNVWTRVKINGSWQAWVVLKPSSGTASILEEGVDNVQRTWTAKQLNEYITDRLKDLSNDDVGGGGVKVYGGSQRKFKDSFSGPGIGSKTYGTFGSVTDKERWILYLSSTAKVVRVGGSSGEDRGYGGGITVELEMDSKWEIAFESQPSDGAIIDRNSPVSNFQLRFTYDGSSGNEKILITNGDYITTKTLDGVWSGKFKITTANSSVAMDTAGYRFKLKT